MSGRKAVEQGAVMNETKTYRGSTLEEVLPKIKAELGPDAEIVRQREGLTGGVGGFFQRACIEVDARQVEAAATATAVAVPERAPRGGRLGGYDDEPARPELPSAPDPKSAFEADPLPVADLP